MIVNGINICDKYGVVVMEKAITPSTVISYDEWLESSSLPLQVREDRYEYGSITVKLFLEGAGDQEALSKMSEITQMCTRCDMGFSDLEYTFPGTVLSATTQKRVMVGAYEFTMKFQAPAKSTEEISISGTGEVIVVNPGNRKGPCVLTLTPTMAIVSLTITGLSDDPIRIKSLEKDQPIVIDGAAGTVLQGEQNKFADYDSWEFPQILPGTNKITLDNSTVQARVEFRPLYV